MKSEKTGLKNETVRILKNQLLRSFLKTFFVGVSCVISITTTAQADNRGFFETWKKIEDFDVGYGCNWTATTPGPESLFEVKKLITAEMIADIDSVEFRLIKPTSKVRTEKNYDGSNFFIKLDRSRGFPESLRILNPYSSDGFCGYILKAQDGSNFDLLRGTDVPIVGLPSRKVLRWIDRETASCNVRLKQAFDPDVVFACRRSINPNSNGMELTDVKGNSVTPEGLIPASVARIYLRHHDTVYSVTTYDNKIEIENLGELK